jgi:hypothetical protein
VALHGPIIWSAWFKKVDLDLRKHGEGVSTHLDMDRCDYSPGYVVISLNFLL